MIPVVVYRFIWINTSLMYGLTLWRQMHSSRREVPLAMFRHSLQKAKSMLRNGDTLHCRTGTRFEMKMARLKSHPIQYYCSTLTR